VHHRVKAWPSRLAVGHEADSLIPAKMIMFRSPEKDARIIIILQMRKGTSNWLCGILSA
jgi:hypothetical protein